MNVILSDGVLDLFGKIVNQICPCSVIGFGEAPLVWAEIAWIKMMSLACYFC